LFEGVIGPVVMNKIVMAIDTFLFIPRSRIQDRAVGEHGASLVGDVEDVSMTFLALFVFYASVCPPAIFFAVICLAAVLEMNDDILEAVQCLGIEKIEGVLGGRQVTVHAVGDHSLAIVDVGGG